MEIGTGRKSDKTAAGRFTFPHAIGGPLKPPFMNSLGKTPTLMLNLFGFRTALGADQTGSAQSTGAPTIASSSTTSATLSINPTATVVTVTQTATSLPTVADDMDCPSPAEPSPTVKLLSQKEDKGTTFELNCGQDNAGFDIMTIMAYKMDDCMRACIMYNHFSQPLRCTGVQFWKPIEASKKVWDGNCFLKNGTVSKIQNKDSGSTVWAKIV